LDQCTEEGCLWCMHIYPIPQIFQPPAQSYPPAQTVTMKSRTNVRCKNEDRSPRHTYINFA
jgi:hypothetical protein